jgi:D-alanyl-D-alanine carboxypeptidase (penicillin-binding protein 5/6)
MDRYLIYPFATQMSRSSLLCLMYLALALIARGATPLPSTQLASKVEARAALLYDSETKQLIFERGIESPYPPASTAKLMTALLVYEKKGLKGSVTICKEDTLVEPSNVPLITGETVSVNDLMHSLLIASDNDSAMALARFVGGTADNFVIMMNARAKELGCTNTHFANPNGLPKNNEYTTAADLLKIFEKAISIPTLREICEMRTYSLKTQSRTQTIVNHNKLLGRYPGMGPAKTGWTSNSRHTYAAAVTRDGRELHLIILNSPDKWKDAQLLFDYGFAHLPEPSKSSPSRKDLVSAKSP